VRRVDYRFQVLRNGVPYAELAAIGTPMIKMQSTAAIARSLSGEFAKPRDWEPNFLRDEIRPQMQLDGQWFSLGVFIASSVSETWSNGAGHLRIEAMDRTLLVKQVSTEGLLHLSAGTPYTTAVTQLLAAAGITSVLTDASADALKAAATTFDELTSADALTTDREDWDEGTSYLNIANALLDEMAYDPLWFDGDGVARLTRYSEPTASNVEHIYQSGANAYIASTCTLTQDIYNPTNVFKAVVSNPDLPEPLTATAVNDSVSSPISTVNLGRRILAPIARMDNIASQNALQMYVERLRFESQLADETVTFTTANTPDHGYKDILALEHERLSGIYQETEWTMQLSYNGQMTHKAKRIIYM
jgi:hypothetical protein